MVRQRNIATLAAALTALPGHEERKAVALEDQTRHYFCEGVYAREFLMPAGYMAVGRVHKYACFNVLLKGKIRIAAAGIEPQTLEAPAFFVSQPGEQKALYAFTDTSFVTFHAHDGVTPAEDMLELMTVPSVEAWQQWKATQEEQS